MRVASVLFWKCSMAHHRHTIGNPESKLLRPFKELSCLGVVESDLHSILQQRSNKELVHNNNKVMFISLKKQPILGQAKK